MNVDGRALAADILSRTKERAAALVRPPRVRAIVTNKTAATKSYVAMKAKRAADAGCVLDVEQIGPDILPNLLLQKIVDTVKIAAETANAVIVQLPLPDGVDTKAVCDVIPTERDADVLSSAARKRFESSDTDALLPPVVGAIRKILESAGVNVTRKKAFIIGRGFLVGTPAAIWLQQQGAMVETADSKTENLAQLLRSADIIVSGVGVPHLIKPEMLKGGAVVIDAGTSESNGAIAGDASPSCAPKCSVFTPVPGGVGPVAVACLFENVVTLAERTRRVL